MRYILLYGGNQGNVVETFAEAERQLADFARITRKSALYRSEAWGFESDDLFYNQVVEIESDAEPLAMLEALQQIERSLGRISKSVGGHYTSRTIDIDILFCDSKIIETERLTIPHPMLHKRRFTLLPLCEYWSEYVHPKLQKTVLQLLCECDDKGFVEKCS